MRTSRTAGSHFFWLLCNQAWPRFHSLLLFVCFFSFVLFFLYFFLCLMLDYFSSLLNSKLCLKWNTLTKALTDSKGFESIADSK